MTHAPRWTRAAAGAAHNWWFDPEGKREEASNSLAMIVLLLPVLLGAFGLGFDVAHNSYVRNTLQGSLDMALAAGSAVTTPGANGELVIDPNNAPQTVKDFYNLNRQKNAGLSCPGGGTPYCWIQPNGDPRVINTVNPTTGAITSSITYTVQEQSKNFFLSIIGVPTQTYTITGTAEITARND